MTYVQSALCQSMQGSQLGKDLYIGPRENLKLLVDVEEAKAEVLE
jgi:hypothetical protein